MDWVTWINTGVGAIGIIVGIIGWKSINAAVKIKNKVTVDNGAYVQQAQTIYNGLDSYAVIRLSRDTTQEELVRLVKELNVASKNDVDNAISELEEKVEALPKIHVGPTEPKNFRNGDLWLDTSDEE